jgi:acetyl esterase
MPSMTSVIPAIEEGERELADHLGELREMNAALADLMGPPGDLRTPEGLQAARKFLADFLTGQAPTIAPETRTIAGVPVRIFVPEKVDAVYLHFHGGGFAIGVAAMNDIPNAEIASACNLAVVSVDYRLAPEHPYPAGPDDCEVVANWLVENAGEEFGTEKLLVGGESAGGNLAAATLIRVRDHIGAADMFLGANLVYGVYDLTGTPSTRSSDDESLVLRRSDIEAFSELYLGDMSWEDRRDPFVSPLYADLSELPPALFTVGGADPLVDDTLFMACRWQMAGNDAELVFYPESPHGFDMFPTKAAARSRVRQTEWLTHRVKGA